MEQPADLWVGQAKALIVGQGVLNVLCWCGTISNEYVPPYDTSWKLGDNLGLKVSSLGDGTR